MARIQTIPTRIWKKVVKYKIFGRVLEGWGISSARWQPASNDTKIEILLYRPITTAMGAELKLAHHVKRQLTTSNRQYELTQSYPPHHGKQMQHCRIA